LDCEKPGWNLELVLYFFDDPTRVSTENARNILVQTGTKAKARLHMELIRRIKSSSLARDTGHYATGQGLRLMLQAAYFVLLARSLGPAQYGAFVAVVALAATLSPFAGLGTSNLFIRNVRSGKRDPGLCWGNGLLAAASSGVGLTGIVLLINHFFHLQKLSIVLWICISDLLLVRITELAAFGFGAIDRAKENMLQTVFASLLRLLSIMFLSVFLHPVTLAWWVGMYVVASVIGALYSFQRAHMLWGKPRVNIASFREDISEGLYFSLGTAASTIYNDIDKVMLGKVSFAAAGLYAAAYRIVDVSMTPVRSLASAAYPHFFKLGTEGIRSTSAFAYTQMRRATLYTAILVPALWFVAPLLPLILGPRYADTAVALRWLALIPFFRGLHTFLADSLSGAGFQRMRSVVQVSIAIVNIVLNLLVLPKYGWLGATWTSLASDGLLVAFLWLAVKRQARMVRNGLLVHARSSEGRA
jgi:O-antigen/teichoic acid export membrane protein